MYFHAYHGVLEDEKKYGNEFLLTLSLDLDTALAGKTDNLDDTLNYQLVYDVVKKEMETPSELIEHIAQRIITQVMKQFPTVQSANLSLSKLNPPLGGKVEKVSISLQENR